MRILLIGLIAAAMMLVAVNCCLAASYQTTRIALPNGNGHIGESHGINSSGTVVGFCAAASGANHAFVWDATRGARDLSPTYGYSSTAQSINDSGTIVGYGGSLGQERAIVWKDQSTMTFLSAFGTESRAYSINNAGIAAGCIWGTDCWQACTWDSAGNRLDLGSLGGYRSMAYGINSTGVVVGTASIFDSQQTERMRGFVWTASTGMLQLPTLGGVSCEAYGINDLGWIVGYSYDSRGVKMPCKWFYTTRTPAAITGISGGIPYAINNKGQIAGSYNSATAVAPFVYDPSTGLMDLGSSFGTGYAINDSGVIAGSYEGAVVWAPVPEPSSILALLTGLAGIGAAALRRNA